MLAYSHAVYAVYTVKGFGSAQIPSNQLVWPPPARGGRIGEAIRRGGGGGVAEKRFENN